MSSSLIPKITTKIEISGLDELAEQLPDSNWYALVVHIRKADSGAEIEIQPTMHSVYDAAIQPMNDDMSGRRYSAGTWW